MKTKSYVMLLSILGVMFVTSCGKDDPSPLTKEEATAKLTTINGDYNTVRSDYENTQGAKVEATLGELTLPFSGLPKKAKSTDPEVFINSLKTSAAKQIAKSNQLVDNFDFTSYVGTWEYNPQSPNLWNRTSTTGDKIVLKFPHPYNNTTNNVTLTYYDYKSQAMLGGVVMTGLKAKIEIGGAVVWSWEYVATFNSLLDFNIKSTTTIGVFTVSDEFDFLMTTNSWVVDAKFIIKKSGAVVYSTSMNATYTQVSQTLVAVVVNASIVVTGVEFRYKLDFDSNDYNSPNTLNPNDLLTMSIYTISGVKVADLKYELTDGYWVLWIYFTNGEKALARNYLSNIVDELDSFFWDDLFSMDEGGMK